MGKAITMATLGGVLRAYEAILRLVKTIDDMGDLWKSWTQVRTLSEHKAQIYDIIDMMMIWYRDVMMLKLTNDPNPLIYPDEYASQVEAKNLLF